MVVVIVSHIQRIGCQPEKTTLHNGQSRSWSAEQGNENKRKKSGSTPPPCPHTPRRSFGENKNKNHATHLQALRRSRSVSRPYKDSESFNDWGGGRGCHNFVPVSGGDGTKISPPEDLFDQTPGEMSLLTMFIFDSSTRLKGVASQNSMLPCAITSFPFSLPPGDV